MNVRTLEQVMHNGPVQIPDHLAADAEVPVIAGLQVQGDVWIVPTSNTKATPTAVPAQGIVVVSGQHDHVLVADGPIAWTPDSSRGADVGLLAVPEDTTAWMLHAEHGATGIAPGCYTIRRQREQADELRLVAD